jgi:filamentous hemagglutinin
VTNSGTIKATNDFSFGAQSIDSAFGGLRAGGNPVLDMAVKTLNQVSASSATRVSSTLGPAASINVTGNAAIMTDGNFEQDAGNLSVGGALGINIGGNWTLDMQETGETKVVARANGVSDTHVVGDTGSSVKVGGAAIAVGGDLTATGASTGAWFHGYRRCRGKR